MDYRNNHGQLSRLKAQQGLRIASCGSGSYASQQRLIKRLLAGVAERPTIETQLKLAELPARACKDYSIERRVERMGQEDIDVALEILDKQDLLDALAYVFGTVERRQELSNSFADSDIAVCATIFAQDEKGNDLSNTSGGL